VDQAYVSRLERGQENARLDTCVKFAGAVGCVYRGTLRRSERRVSGLSQLDIAGLNDFTLEACGKFAAAVGCVYVSELQPIAE
jgi:hypothetical protein